MTDKDKSKNKGKGGKDGETRDKDSLDRLPLSGMPLSSNALRGAKLVKNARMETAVEIHSDPVSGSLQIAPENISDFMVASPRDKEILQSLAGLNSFDVYSLRTSLQRIGVQVEDVEALDLSDDMKHELAAHSLAFVRPLVEKIFGAAREDLLAAGGLEGIFRDPDVNRVRENLRIMSQRTGIPLADIPAFLKDYSDVYLSVAYYSYGFENVTPSIENFLTWIHGLHHKRGEDAAMARAMDQGHVIEETVRFLFLSLRERLGKLEEDFRVFWDDISPASFASMRKRIEGNHDSIGAVLCGLMVKMNGWKRAFPDQDAGGPATRLKFVLTDLEPGLMHLRGLEIEARKNLKLSVFAQGFERK